MARKLSLTLRTLSPLRPVPQVLARHFGGGLGPRKKREYFWQEFKDAEKQKRASRRREDTGQPTGGSLRNSKNYVFDEMDADTVLGFRPRRPKGDIGAEITNATAPRQELARGHLTAATVGEVHRDPIATMRFQPGSAPALLSAFETILACKSAGAVLKHCMLLERHEKGVAEMAVAVQFLCRWATGYQKSRLLQDDRLTAIYDTLAEETPLLEPWALLSTLWSLAKLDKGHACGSAVLEAVSGRIEEFSIEQLSLALRCLAQSSLLYGTKCGKDLAATVLDLLRHHAQELMPGTAAALVPALAQLRLTDGPLNTLGKTLAQGADAVHVQDLAAATAGLVTLRTIQPSLLRRAQGLLEREVHLCTPRAVVQFSMALSEAGSPEVFQDHLMPAVRTFVLDFSPRDLCNIAEAFTKVRAADGDLLAELAHSLLPKTSKMDPHDVSVALNLFQPVAYAVPALLPAVVARARAHVDDFSPRQVARVLRGVTNAGLGADLLDDLRSRAIALSHVFFGTSAVDVLVALNAAHCLTPSVFASLLRGVQRSLELMPSRDHVVTLRLLCDLPVSLQDSVPTGFQEELLQVLRRKDAPWSTDLDCAVNFLEAFQSLHLEDDVLLEFVVSQFAGALEGSRSSLSLFFRALHALTNLSHSRRHHVRVHLHERPRVHHALHDELTRHLARRPAFLEEVSLAFECARLGYETERTQVWFDSLVHVADNQSHHLEATCNLCWAFAQLSWQPDWTRQQALSFVARRYRGCEVPADEAVHGSGTDFATSSGPTDPVPAEALLRMAWVFAAVNEEVPIPLLQELHLLYKGLLPSDVTGVSLELLQSVALHCRLGPQGGAVSGDPISRELQEWLDLVAEAPRDDFFMKAPPRTRSRGRQDGAQHRLPERWLSATLAELKIAHKVGARIHAYRVAIKLGRQVFDLRTLADLSAPAGRTLGTAELRRRHLVQLGWVVHPITLKDIQDSLQTGTLRLFVSKLLSSSAPGTQSSFRPSLLPKSPPRKQVHVHKPANANEGRHDRWPSDEELDEEHSLRPRGAAVLNERARRAMQRISSGPSHQEER